jgi:hypothetical protein
MLIFENFYYQNFTPIFQNYSSTNLYAHFPKLFFSKLLRPLSKVLCL